MAKKIRNLLNEIDKKYKESEEGITVIDNLQSKLEQAPTQSMKEKFESEMKKEIKKLQRLRDFFRTNQNNPDIKDKSKLDNGRKMIENEMERFREHEKEFKMKQYSKRALQANFESQGNFVGGSSNSDMSGSDDYGSSGGSEDSDDNDSKGSNIESEEEYVRRDSIQYGEEDNVDDSKLAKDKEWLDRFIQDKLKKSITKVEAEVDNIRNKKIRGTSKKQKDMLKTLNDRLKLMRSTRLQCEELAMTMEFLEGGAIKQLRANLKKYHENDEDDQLRINVDNEVQALIDRADQNRKEEDLLHSGLVTNCDDQEEEKKQEVEETNKESKFGYLEWLDKLINLHDCTDLHMQKKLDSSQLKEGMIIDAQDYLDKWYLAIICKVQPNNDQEYVKVNFLPYPKGNRDEWISKTEMDRLSGPFVNCDFNQTDSEYLQKSITGLRAYYSDKFLAPSTSNNTPQQSKGGKGKKTVVQSQPPPKKEVKTEKPVAQMSKKKEVKVAKKEPEKREELQQKKADIVKKQDSNKSPVNVSEVSNKTATPETGIPKMSFPPLGGLGSALGSMANSTQPSTSMSSAAPSGGGLGGGMFGGANPFANLAGQYKDIKQIQSIQTPFKDVSKEKPAFAPMQDPLEDFTKAPPASGTQSNYSAQPTSSSSPNPFLDMLNCSFINNPLLSDQDVIEPKCPIPVDEAIQFQPSNQTQMMAEIFKSKRYFPTSAMYDRQNHIQRMDLESLFFAFYYQQGTYQQYLAALVLKKRGWEYHIRFQTWIKKETVQEYTRGGKQQTKTKVTYFDFENEWKVKNSAGEFDSSDPKFSSQIENELQLPPTPIPNENSHEAEENLTQEKFESQFLIGSIKLPSQVVEQLCK